MRSLPRDGTIERVRVQPYSEYGATRHLEEGVNCDISPPWGQHRDLTTGQHTYKSLALVPSMLEPGPEPTGIPAWQPSQHYATPHAGADVCVLYVCPAGRPAVSAWPPSQHSPKSTHTGNSTLTSAHTHTHTTQQPDTHCHTLAFDLLRTA